MNSFKKVLWINFTILSIYTLLHYMGLQFSAADTNTVTVIYAMVYWSGFWMSAIFMAIHICLNLMISAVLFFQKDGRLAPPFLWSALMITIVGFIANYIVFGYHLSTL